MSSHHARTGFSQSAPRRGTIVVLNSSHALGSVVRALRPNATSRTSQSPSSAVPSNTAKHGTGSFSVMAAYSRTAAPRKRSSADSENSTEEPSGKPTPCSLAALVCVST